MSFFLGAMYENFKLRLVLYFLKILTNVPTHPRSSRGSALCTDVICPIDVDSLACSNSSTLILFAEKIDTAIKIIALLMVQPMFYPDYKVTAI